MIIQSSSIGTSASRRYQSTTSSYVEHSEWDNATGTSFTQACSKVMHTQIATSSYNGALNDNPLLYSDNSEYKSSNDEISAEEITEENNATKQELEDLYARFKPFQTRIPTIQERLEMVRDIQQKSLDYLLRILFGDAGKYVKDIVKEALLTETSAQDALKRDKKVTLDAF